MVTKMKKLLYYSLFTISYSLLIGCESDEEVKQKRYFAAGNQLYETHCANCHQADGKGLARLYPPIANSDFLAKNKAMIMCGMKYGMKDTLTIYAQRYTQPMPPNAQLYALDIAEITSYIYIKWGKEKKITEGKDVEKVLDKCGRD